MNEKIAQLLEQKCSVGDCNEKQMMFMSIPIGNGISQVMPFCFEHVQKIMLGGFQDRKSEK